MAILGFPDVLGILLVKEFYPLLNFLHINFQCSVGKKNLLPNSHCEDKNTYHRITAGVRDSHCNVYILSQDHC